MLLVNEVQQFFALAGRLSEEQKAAVPQLRPVLLFRKKGNVRRVLKIGEVFKVRQMRACDGLALGRMRCKRGIVNDRVGFSS